MCLCYLFSDIENWYVHIIFWYYLTVSLGSVYNEDIMLELELHPSLKKCSLGFNEHAQSISGTREAPCHTQHGLVFTGAARLPVPVSNALPDSHPAITLQLTHAWMHAFLPRAFLFLNKKIKYETLHLIWVGWMDGWRWHVRSYWMRMRTPSGASGYPIQNGSWVPN